MYPQRCLLLFWFLSLSYYFIIKETDACLLERVKFFTREGRKYSFTGSIMRALVQRVKYASVSVEGVLINKIGRGLLVFAGFHREDSENDLNYLADKITSLRIFPEGEKEGVHSVKDIGGEVLLISQFTLYGNVKKGNRPSFSEAMPAQEAKLWYEKLYDKIAGNGINLKKGVFQAMMDIELLNEGPYTISIDSVR